MDPSLAQALLNLLLIVIVWRLQMRLARAEKALGAACYVLTQLGKESTDGL